MKKVFTLIRYFSKSLLTHNATLLFLFLGVLMLIVAFMLSDVNIVVRFKLFEDVLLSSQMFLLHLAALFYAYDLLGRNSSQGLFVLPLSTGLSRDSYLLALAGTLCTMILVLLALFLAVDSFLLYMLQGMLPWIVLWQLCLYAFSAMFLILLILALCQYVYVMNAVLYGVAFFMVGNGLDELYVFATHMQNDSVLQTVSTALYYGLPNFSFFDIQSIAINRAHADIMEVVAFPLLYFFGAGALLFAVASYRFGSKALRVGE